MINNGIKYVSIIVVAFLFLEVGALPVLAANWQREEAGTNKLKVKGDCSGGEVTIYLYPKSGGDSIYSAGAECKNGRFKFEDDLTPWNIPDNSYKVVVGKGQGNPDFSKVEELSVWQRIEDALSSVFNPGPQEPPPSSDPNEPFVQASGNFSSNLQGLSGSLDSMKQLLSDTTYPSAVRAILSSFLTTIETAVNSIKDVYAKLDSQIAQPNEPISTPTPQPSVTPTLSPSPAPSPIPPTPTPLEASPSAQ